MAKYSTEEAERILGRCVDAGLWMTQANPDLEEYAESYEKEKQRQAALEDELEPEVVAKPAQEVEEDLDDFEVHDVFSKLVINPNREVKEQPGFYNNHKDSDSDSDSDVEVPHPEDSNDDSGVSDDYVSGDEESFDSLGKKKKYIKEYEYDLKDYEGRELTEEEQLIRDQLLDLVKKNKNDDDDNLVGDTSSDELSDSIE